MLINPRSPGTQWGLRLAIQAARVLPPGAVLRTKLVWKRCKPTVPGEDSCPYSNTVPVLICGPCWEQEKVFAGLIILGPIDAPLGVECERCGGRDNEVQGYPGATYDVWRKIPGRLYYSPETKKLEVEP